MFLKRRPEREQYPVALGYVERRDGRREDCRREEDSKARVDGYGEHDSLTDLWKSRHTHLPAMETAYCIIRVREKDCGGEHYVCEEYI